MKYILLLRGVNVGGKNKVSMAELKETIKNYGYTSVVTYLNSGNIIFETEKAVVDVKKEMQIILSKFVTDIKMVILTKDEYLDEILHLPDWWNESMARKDVLFYTDDVDYEQMKKRISNMTLHNEIVYFGQKAVFWGKYTEKEYTKTAYHRLLIKEDFYSLITIRNGRTFEKLAERI